MIRVVLPPRHRRTFLNTEVCVSSSLLLLEKVVKVVHVAVCSSCRRTYKRSRDGLPGNNNCISRTLHFMPPSSTVASKVSCTICRPTSVARKVGLRVIRPSTLTTLLRLRSGTTNPIGHGTEDQALARACPQAQANLCVSEGCRHQRSRGLCWPWALYPRSYGSV